MAYPPGAFLAGYLVLRDAHEVLHEWTFLYTEHEEMYFVLAILGVEYAINMGGPDIEGYKLWLKEHGNKSPLYL